MKRIMVFDTSLVSENMGDRIIMSYCSKCINQLFEGSFISHVPTHDVIGDRAYQYAKISDYKIVCGTNLLNTRMNKRRQWRITLKDSRYVNDVILLGVGWWQYEERDINAYTKHLLRSLLSINYLHSVRDEYTKQKLNSLGFHNVINTACPTMWGLTPELCASVPKKKSDEVIFTVTDYMRSPEDDRFLVEYLKRTYKKVYMWIQSFDDFGYVKSIADCSGIEFIPPSLEMLDRVLDSKDVDYVGNRLHAGIRALNHGKRTVVIGVDNRAKEISKDTGLPVVDRKCIQDRLPEIIETSWETSISLPAENIRKWRMQFNNE